MVVWYPLLLAVHKQSLGVSHILTLLLCMLLLLLLLPCVCVCHRDALLRRLTLRFVLCRAALTLHTVAGRNPAHLPTVFPELPKEVRRGQQGGQRGK